MGIRTSTFGRICFLNVFFTSCSCFWIFGILECIFFLLFSFENFESVFGIRIYAVWGGGERCKTFVTINWFSGLAARALYVLLVFSAIRNPGTSSKCPQQGNQWSLPLKTPGMQYFCNTQGQGNAFKMVQYVFITMSIIMNLKNIILWKDIGSLYLLYPIYAIFIFQTYR